MTFLSLINNVLGITGTWYFEYSATREILLEGITCTCHNPGVTVFRDAVARRGAPRATMELSDMGPDLRWNLDNTISYKSNLISLSHSGGLESLARLELPSSTGSSFSPGGDFNPNPSHFSPTSHRSDPLTQSCSYCHPQILSLSHFPTSDFPTPGEEFSPGGLSSIQSQPGVVTHLGHHTAHVDMMMMMRFLLLLPIMIIKISDRSQKRGWSNTLIARPPNRTPCHCLPVLSGILYHHLHHHHL